MIRKSSINSLAELKRRKKQVRMETEVAKREFAHTLGTTRGNAGNFLLKNVALPAGGAVLGMVILSKLFSSKKMPVVKETRVVHEYPDGQSNPRGPRRSKRRRLKQFTSMMGVVRVLVPIVQAILGSYHTHKAKEAAKSAESSAKRK